jgi:two-component system chemotaxis response regulator CheY
MEGQSTPPNQRQFSPKMPGHPHRVLLVEDTETTRQRITGLLRSQGYHVDEATNGLDALRKVSAAPYDAILLDLVLPNVDGWQFRETQLRHPELASIPTVVVTVRALREQDRYALRTQDVLQKPFEDPALLTVVQRACARGATATAFIPARELEASPPELFWSKRGAVACGGHVPPRGSQRWLDERWCAIPEGAGQDRVSYQCQYCPGSTGPIRHVSRGEP